MADDIETVDTSIAADERLSGEGKAPAKAPPSFAAAGAAFLAGLSAEQQSAPLADIDDDGGRRRGRRHRRRSRGGGDLARRRCDVEAGARPLGRCVRQDGRRRRAGRRARSETRCGSSSGPQRPSHRHPPLPRRRQTPDPALRPTRLRRSRCPALPIAASRTSSSRSTTLKSPSACAGSRRKASAPTRSASSAPRSIPSGRSSNPSRRRSSRIRSDSSFGR
jgi:hypothetical protein